MPSMLQLSKRGAGVITVLNNNPRIQKLKLLRVLPEVDGPIVETFCNFSKALENSKRVRVFVDFLREIFTHEKQQKI